MTKNLSRKAAKKTKEDLLEDDGGNTVILTLSNVKGTKKIEVFLVEILQKSFIHMMMRSHLNKVMMTK